MMAEKKLLLQKKTLRRILLILLAALVVIFGSLYVVSRTFGRVPLSNLADVFTAFSVKGGGSFPYVTDAGNVVRMVQIGGGVGVLRTDRFDILTRSGATLQSVPHTYTSPAVDVCGGRALLYDRGGTRYMLLSKTGVLCTDEIEQKQKDDPEKKNRRILTAALAEDGRIAIAVSSENTKSILTVYKANGSEFSGFFQYKCVSEYITDIAFTQNGVALTVVGAKNASAYSRLISLRFNKTEPLADFTYEDTSLFHVHASGSTVTACSSTLQTTLRRKTQLPDVLFGSDTLQFFCADESGRATLALLTYGNEHESKLRGLAPNGETAFEADCGEKLKDMSRSSAYTSVLTDDAVLTYNNSGSCVGTLTLTQAARSICLNDRTVFVLFNDHIDAFPAAGEHKDS
jgi:hypothetical protein